MLRRLLPRHGAFNRQSPNLRGRACDVHNSCFSGAAPSAAHGGWIGSGGPPNRMVKIPLCQSGEVISSHLRVYDWRQVPAIAIHATQNHPK